MSKGINRERDVACMAFDNVLYNCVAKIKNLMLKEDWPQYLERIDNNFFAANDTE